VQVQDGKDILAVSLEKAVNNRIDVFRYVQWDGPTQVNNAPIYIDGQPIQANMKILVGNHEVSIENGCAESRQNIVVRKGQKIDIQPNWIPKTRDIDIHYLGSNNEEQVGNVLVDGVSRGTTPLKLSIPVCSSVQVQDGKDILAVSLEKAVNNRIDVSKFTYVQGNGYKALLIPAGSFTMGCTSEQGSDCYGVEKPSHTVKISKAFYLMESEVTQELYEKVMDSNPSYFKGSKRPVDNVSWYDAVTFANKLSALEGRQQCYQISGSNVSWTKNCMGWRLPTEAEWEYASRGGQSYKYAGSNTVGDVAWYTDNSRGETHDVCGKQKNGYGLCDMSGNVYEWVWDFWGSYSSRTQVDPQGPTSGSARVNRGGGWGNSPELGRVSGRNGNTPTIRGSGIGFRLGLSP
jgi:formylglycine-generating enzyme required for sulfatase activity